MYLNPARRLIFLAHPRTASRSVRDVLLERGFHHEALNPDSEFEIDRSPGAHHATLSRHPGDGWTVFTVVRNHFDAWASWWGQQGPAFGAMPADFPTRFTIRKRRYWPRFNEMWGLHRHVADIVLRYEDLNAGLASLLNEPGLVVPKAYVTTVRAGAPYQDVIGADAAWYIGERFHDEMAELGYTWEGASDAHQASCDD